MASHGFKGHLADVQVPYHGDLMAPAYDAMTKILEDPERKETAWVCVTTPPALGAMRAMLDKGLQPGDADIAILLDQRRRHCLRAQPASDFS